jgi:hypothetical protein
MMLPETAYVTYPFVAQEFIERVMCCLEKKLKAIPLVKSRKTSRIQAM